jgi:hypothetical protein
MANKPLVDLVTEMTAEITKRDAEIAALKNLLRQAAPKCEECEALATGWTDETWLCETHRRELEVSDDEWWPWKWADKIKAALEE